MLLALYSLFFLGLASFSLATEPGAAATAFESHYRGAHTLQAKFLEEYREQGRITRSEAGTVYFQKPGKMRWEYASPENTLFLVDGKDAWFYVPADHAVTRVPARRSSDWRTPLALLAGEMKLSRICRKVGIAENEKPADSSSVVLSCKIRGAHDDPHSRAHAETPVRDKDADVVLFEVLRSTGELVRVQVRDPGGIVIEFHFKNWQLNLPLASRMFRFSPPLGVAIVNGELPSADGAVKP